MLTNKVGAKVLHSLLRATHRHIPIVARRDLRLPLPRVEATDVTDTELNKFPCTVNRLRHRTDTAQHVRHTALLNILHGGNITLRQHAPVLCKRLRRSGTVRLEPLDPFRLRIDVVSVARHKTCATCATCASRAVHLRACSPRTRRPCLEPLKVPCHALPVSVLDDERPRPRQRTVRPLGVTDRRHHLSERVPHSVRTAELRRIPSVVRSIQLPQP